ncbi:retrovirus-related pol polyprotein from transposon TNT 1-94 [Tanacetum coccineum]
MFSMCIRKSKKSSHQPKTEDTNQEKLYLLHMDLCVPMRVASINGKRYILVIVDDYSRFTWVRFLRTKDEALEAIIKCIKNIQVRLNATVRNVRTDNGTKFVNQTLRKFYENVIISHQTSVARTPQQNDITKAAQYDLPGIKDMVPDIWVPVKVAYDKHALWGISHWREQLRRADNDLYRFKEGDFPRLRINDIEDMLLLVVQNRLTNLSKKINVTRPETTKSGIRKRDPYTPYQDPQGFIYVDNNGRNRLMRSDELYKFSDRTLTGLRTSLDDITKNIRMEYLPKRRWSTLEKKRANIMINAINKQLKERRTMRSLEKFIGGRDYGTDLRLLQRTI